MMPKLVTLSQINYKRRVDFELAIKSALVEGVTIPNMLVSEIPIDPETERPDQSFIDDLASMAYVVLMQRYGNLIYFMPANPDLETMPFIDAYLAAYMCSMSLKGKYETLCQTVPMMDDEGKIGGMSPLEWYLHNYKVATTGTVGTESHSEANTDMSTTYDKHFGSQTKGTSGESSATPRVVEEVYPVRATGDTTPDTTNTKGDVEDNYTDSNSTTTYNTLKEGYYNTGNKTTIMKDMQDMAFKAPFFYKWLEELVASFTIPIYSSTFGFKTE